LYFFIFNRRHKEVLAAALEKEENERKKALTEQMEAKHKEMTEKISHIEKSERKKAEDALQATKQSYEVEIVKLKAEIQDKVDDINKHVKSIKALELAKSNVEVKLMEVYTGYQDFINRVKPFEKGMSDYLLNPVYIDEVGKVPEL
jgi:ActR/RegA family two-component response regulator